MRNNYRKKADISSRYQINMLQSRSKLSAFLSLFPLPWYQQNECNIYWHCKIILKITFLYYGCSAKECQISQSTESKKETYKNQSTDFEILRVRLNYATNHHHPPQPTTTHHQPKYIHHHPPPAKIYPPPPTTSQNISTNTHHDPPTAKTFFIRNPFTRISSHCLRAS